MSESDSIESRLTEVEFQLAHIQRAYEELNQVVTEQALLVDRMKRKIDSYEREIKELKRRAEPESDPLDEKPPHY